MKKAVVVGGTGAIGREVVGVLLTSGQWSHVVTVGRRPVEVPASYAPSAYKAKLEQVVVNMDNLESEASAAFAGSHTVFCTLGTTRKVAGSAEGFLKVDLEYVEKTAKAAKAAGVPNFSLVTSTGANANVWANHMGLFHGLLYMQTKGKAEEAVKAQGFAHVDIYRPGMLDRQDLARANEKLFMKLASSIQVVDVAKCMVRHAERSDAEKAAGASLYSMAALQAAVKDDSFMAVSC